MKNSEEIKQVVREKYSEIAQQSKTQNASSCCGVGGCNSVDYTIFSDDYSQLAGYHEGADLGLGCGLPTEFAQIKTNDTVVDLGSGAGNDCFVARSFTGPAGTVIGIDMTQAMIVKARENATKLGFDNVQFRLGDIEELPLQNNIADVVVSNCVMNLVPDKSKAFAETYRILKPGGHFSISDVVLEGALPLGLQQAAEMYAGCVSGALQKTDYLDIIKQAGFTNISIQKQKSVIVPDEILLEYITTDQLHEFKNAQTGIFSITVFAEKPKANCCAPNSGCC
ncbi:MAG: arsenite methyltransferase [Saprospiraceae bacterium]|uniref:Arsenite methyltransferase n=1 Tax=Candidatus Defluviibacterium haderslevense TaxID=2981993 RepID=A0A9D7S6Z2_9BACT|nr:arsenite methyltransferase [Candidatus Defluviibacterium haderslevense]MBL0238660.1 arsenite methyltransferase [Candidatus Defluviibacterium haderslevense]